MAEVEIREDLLTTNPYSRPGIQLIRPEYIVLHWVANPRTTAQQNHDFWESRKDGGSGYGGGHYIVDDREVVQCVPDEEIAPHVGTSQGITRWAEEAMGAGRHKGYSQTNYFTLGVELCHEDWEGAISPATWQNAVELVSHLCARYRRDPWRDIVTHELVVGWKKCPRWMADHPAELLRFQRDVGRELEVDAA